MSRPVYVGAIASCLFLMIGSIWFPDGAGMWLASSSLIMNVVRGVLVGLFIGLMITNPPRRRLFRAALGIIAFGLTGWSINWALSGTMNLIDSVMLLEAAIAFGLAAIELAPIESTANAEPVKTLTFFAKNFQITSSLQGVVVPPVRLAEVLQRTTLKVTILTGSLHRNVRPYRELWRGS